MSTILDSTKYIILHWSSLLYLIIVSMVKNIYLFILQLWYLTNKNTRTVNFSLYSNWQYIILLLWHPYMKPWNLTYDSICTVFAGFWCHSFIIEISLYFYINLILLTWLQIKDRKFISFVFIIFLNVEQSAMNCHPLSILFWQ
jgi:hypothetical protein